MKGHEARAPAATAAHLVAAAAARGLDPAPLRDLIGLPDGPLDPDLTVSSERCYRAWEAILRALRDPGFPVFMGSTPPEGYLGVLGFVVMTAPTIGEALRRVERYQRIFQRDTHLSLHRHGEELEWRVEGHGHEVLGERLANEAILAQSVCNARRIAGDGFDPLRVWIRHAAPADTSAHERYFRCPVIWGARHNSLFLRTDMLDAPLRLHDPALSAFLEARAEEALRKLPGVESTTAEVRRRVEHALREGLPSLALIARELACSPRTLRRRLAEEDTSFEEVLDAVRRELARVHLEEGRLSIQEIAWLLRYSEPSAFQRAFRRWFGTTPLRFRAKAG